MTDKIKITDKEAHTRQLSREELFKAPTILKRGPKGQEEIISSAYDKEPAEVVDEACHCWQGFHQM